MGTHCEPGTGDGREGREEGGGREEGRGGRAVEREGETEGQGYVAFLEGNRE